MTTRVRSAVVPALLTASVALLGCSQPHVDDSRELALRIGVPVPQAAGARSGIPNLIAQLTTESLIVNGPDGRPSPRLAKGWSWNADHTVLHVELEQGVSFHDGTPLTPEIVAQSLRQEISNQNGLAISNAKRIETSGTGIDIVLPAPDSFLLEDLGTLSMRRPDAPLVGTGPYKVVSNGPSAKLAAFDKYYKGLPNIRSISISPYPTQRNAWAALMRSDIDMLQEVSPDAVDFVEAESAVRAYSFPKPYYYVLGFNVRGSILSNVEVRRAINEAIDKNAIVSDGLHGRARPAVDPIWPEFWAVSSQPKTANFNPEDARHRLEAAGYSMHPGTDSRPASRIRLNCLVWADDARLVRTALLLQKQLAQVGIDVELKPAPLNELVPTLRKGQFDMFLFELANARTMSYVYLFWHSPLPSSPPYNFTGYRAADAALDAIRSATSDDQIRQHTAELQQVFADDPPAVFLAWETMTRAVSSNFAVAVQPGRDIMYSIWEWKPADGRPFAER